MDHVVFLIEIMDLWMLLTTVVRIYSYLLFIQFPYYEESW